MAGILNAKETLGLLGDFPKRLRLARERCGLSQAKLAGALEIHPTTIYRLENGDMAPSIGMALLLVRELGVTFDELLFGKPCTCREMK